MAFWHVVALQDYATFYTMTQKRASGRCVSNRLPSTPLQTQSDFQNYSVAMIRGVKFVIRSSLKMPPHLKRVATLLVKYSALFSSQWTVLAPPVHHGHFCQEV